MDLGLKGKKVLIVGIGNGIGKAIAIAYSQEGALITGISRDREKCRKLFSLLNQSGHRNTYVIADLMQDGLPKTTALSLLETEKSFDIIVHNIGHTLGLREPLAPINDWYQVWKLNIGIAIEMNEVLIPPMIRAHWGRVIHLSSISARTLRGSPQYCTSKAYINAYVTTVGRYLADKGVILTSVMPGAVEFDGGYWHEIKNSNPDKYYGFLKEHQAIGRMGTPEEIAAFVLFLGSVHSSFVPGANIAVDGGSM